MMVSRATAEDAAKELLIHAFFVGDTLTEQVVKEAYRSRAQETHPDKGGTLEEFAAVDRAKHVLLEWIKRRDPEPVPGMGGKCPVCHGDGFVRTQRGFAAPMRRTCPRCRGTGDINYEHEKGGD